MINRFEKYDEYLERLETKLDNILKTSNEKDDKILELLNDNKTQLLRQHHDLYGNGKKGLFEEFNDFKKDIIQKQEFLQKQVNKNSRYIWGYGLIVSFIGFLPTLRDFIKDLVR